MIHVATAHVPPLSAHATHEEVAVPPSPLLGLPVELVPHIFCYLSKDDLCSVSLVDTVCRRLAALELFEALTIDLSCGNKAYTCMDELKLLQGSTESRVSITPCVRRLIVKSRVALPQSPDEMVQRGYNMGPCYIEAMCHLMEKLLFNVHVIDWDVTGAMPPHVFQAIVSSSAKHIRVQKTAFTKSFQLTHSSSALESLNIDLSWFPPETDRSSERILTVFDELLSRSSRTLRQLIWEGYRTKVHVDMQSCHFFPQLRTLTLDQVAQNTDHIISVFLNSNTRVSTLAMDSLSEASRQFYRSRGHVATLDHFCWINHENDAAYEDVFVFLQANDQLNAFQVTSALSPTVINDHLLPMLQNDFRNLTSLRLIWADQQISESSLHAIAELVSLRHLWLSAGNQNIYRNTWLVEHDVMLEKLKPLQHLQTLAFSHDTYESKVHPLAPRFGDYYANKHFPEDLAIENYLEDEEYDAYRGIGFDAGYEREIELQIEMRCIAWERMHRQRMLDIGHSYAMTFKSLGWMYVGQLPLIRNMKGASSSSKPVINVDANNRDPAGVLLKKRLCVMAWTPES